MAGRHPRLLLVDDDVVSTGATRRLLRTARPDWRILRAESHGLARDELERWSFDVAIVDLLGPTCDPWANLQSIQGIQLLRHLRREFPTTVRVVHSGRVRQLATNPELSAATYVVRKPIPGRELLSVLDRAVALARGHPGGGELALAPLPRVANDTWSPPDGTRPEPRRAAQTDWVE